jgi:signal transduction histidine kinase
MPRGRAADASALIDAIFPESANESGWAGPASDLQSLLSGAVRDLARRAAATHVCAWLRDEEGHVWPVAIHQREARPGVVPDEETFGALLGLGRATDLGLRGVAPALARFAAASGLAAAIALSPSDERPGRPALGVLAVGSPDDPPGRVRPRTLALLEQSASELAGPLATADALGRMARLDEDVRWLDRRAALGELIAEVVHEVRNPLVSVKTFLQLLPTRLDDTEFLTDFRLVVVEEMLRLERLLDSVLRHAGPGQDQSPEPTAGVDDVFETTLQLLGHRARERRIVLEQSAEPASEVALARDALRQILLNLTLNALDATPAGGRVALHARGLDAVDGRWIEISVDDGGEGIPEAERERVFDAFYSTRGERPGGLGLAITRRLVEEAGGTIRVGEGRGGGARMLLRLPAAARL